MRAGIPTVVAPEENRKDLAEIPANIKRRLRFAFVTNMDQVLDEVMVKPLGRAAGRRPSRAAAGRATAAH
jgi:ATP-dependent Lon protease